MPVICRLPQKSSGGSVVLTGTAVEGDVASGKTFYNTDSNTKLTGTGSIVSGMTIPVGVNGRPTGDVVLPSGMTSLYQYVFYFNTAVTSVVMPNTILSMDTNSFDACSNLESCTLSTGLTIIPNFTFRNCAKLTNPTFHEGITNIGQYAYGSCSAITNITLPSTITTIENYAFNSCSNAITLTLNFTVANIALLAFNGMSNLEYVNLPNNFDSSIRLLSSTKYSASTILAMFNALKDNTGFTAKTLTLGATNLAKMSDAEKLIATNRNWILV